MSEPTEQKSTWKFTFSRDELLEIQQDFLAILKSPEAIEKEWVNLDGYAGNGIVSIAELELWLCVRFPILRNSLAIRMTFYKVLKFSGSKNGFIQKQAMQHLLVIIFCSNQALRWWNELPSKSADKVVAWLAQKKVETRDERMPLESSRRQLAPNAKLQNLQSRIATAIESNSMFCIEFDFFCDLMASFKTTQMDVMYCNLNPCLVDQLDFSVKPREFLDIQNNIRNKVLKATRGQDHLSASILPYMKDYSRRSRSYASRPLTSSSQCRSSSSQSFINNTSGFANHRHLSGELFVFEARPTTPKDATASATERPTTSSSSLLSVLTGRGNIADSLEACESAGEVVPGILYTKNADLFQTRCSYLKTFGLQHPHTGAYFCSPHHNDLLSEKQLAEYSASLPDYASRLRESPLNSPTFQLLRNKPGKNPLVFPSERSPSNFDKHTNLTMHPRRPWSSEFASSSSVNRSFSKSSESMAKNRSPVTRALSPTSAMLLFPAASPHDWIEKAPSASKKGPRRAPEWDSSGSPLGYFEKANQGRFSKTEWT
jgi:hypothetical protein